MEGEDEAVSESFILQGASFLHSLRRCCFIYYLIINSVCKLHVFVNVYNNCCYTRKDHLRKILPS